jgi:hypothetical protein
MKIYILLSASLCALSLTSCTASIYGNKILADKQLSDSSINLKIIDNKSTMQMVDNIFGKRDTGRSIKIQSFPDGKLSIATYHGNLNGLGGTYAHRVLYVAYDANDKVINHDIITNNFSDKNNYEKDYLKYKNIAYYELARNDKKEKAISILGEPKKITFSDEGNLMLVYEKNVNSRDASSYIPIYNYANSTESGISERLYLEFGRNDELVNIYSASVQIIQGRGIVNAESYDEKFMSLSKLP